MRGADLGAVEVLCTGAEGARELAERLPGRGPRERELKERLSGFLVPLLERLGGAVQRRRLQDALLEAAPFKRSGRLAKIKADEDAHAKRLREQVEAAERAALEAAEARRRAEQEEKARQLEEQRRLVWEREERRRVQQEDERMQRFAKREQER